MKRLGLAFLFALGAASTASALLWIQPSRFSGGGGGGSYLVNQDFEGSSAPSDWVAASYTPSGTYDWGYTTSPLSGSKSYHDTSSSNYPSISFTTQSNVWIYFTWKGVLSGYDEFLRLYDGGTYLAALKHLSSGTVQLFENGGGYASASSSSGALADSTKTHFWVHRNGTTTLEFWIGSTGTRGSAEHVVVSGPSVSGSIDSVSFRYAAGTAFWFDDVKISSTELYDNGSQTP